MTVSVLWLFITLPWVGLQCVIVVFPDHTLIAFLGLIFNNCNGCRNKKQIGPMQY